MSENKTNKKPAETKKAAAPKKTDLKKSNKARLSKYSQEHSSEKESKFKVATSHPYMNKNDSCVVQGIVNFTSYVGGYVKLADAEKAVEQLNKQYFN